MNKKIYFDNAATSGRKPNTVIDAVCDCLKNANANPGRSGHSLSVKASEIIYATRETIGEFFRFPRTENIALTKNATEALNIVLYGLLKTGDEVITTSMEHNSVMRPLNDLIGKGVISVKKLMADANGIVSPQQVNEAISKQTKLIVMTSASNVTGTKMDIEGVHAAANASGAKLLIDGAQGAGAMQIDWGKTPFDFLAITGHKHLFGPQGTGALLVKNPDDLTPLMRGGTGSLSEKTVQPDFPPDKFEAGTVNTPGFAGLTAGIRFLLHEGMENIIQQEQQLMRYLITGLSAMEEVELYAPVAERTATVSFNVTGSTPSDVAHYLDAEWGILSRAGLHCAPEAHKTLNTFPRGTVRFSLSCFNTAEEIDVAVHALQSYIRNN